MLEAIRYSVDNGVGSLLLLEQVSGSGIERLACDLHVGYMARRATQIDPLPLSIPT